MCKEKEKKNDSIDLQVYYAALSKKDKSNLLTYLMVTYDMNYNTIRRKLSGSEGYYLNTLERIACLEAKDNEIKWKD
jgi:hypothetical protein|nr:MAG TPA: hypothetical protein [Caudoviricetes sp.]